MGGFEISEGVGVWWQLAMFDLRVVGDQVSKIMEQGKPILYWLYFERRRQMGPCKIYSTTNILNKKMFLKEKQ